MADIYSYIKGDFKTAVTFYNKAIDIHPTDSICISAGACYRRLGDSDNALKEYKKAMEINPKNASTYNGLGLLYFSNEDYEKGIYYIQKALEIDSTDAYFNENIGYGYYSIKKYEEAIFYYQKAIELKPRTASAYRRLGKAYLDKGKISKLSKEDNLKMFRYWIKAAQLGDEEARYELRKENIDWTKYNLN